MPYDAFGNKVDDDPLAGLSSAGSQTSGVPGARPPRRGGPILVAVVVVLVLLGLGGALVYLSAGDEQKAPAAASTAAAPQTEVAEARPDPEVAATPPEPVPETKPTAPSRPPAGLQRGSLLRRANLAVALRRLRAEAKGRPRNVRVAAERVDVQVVLRDGRLRSAQATWDGEVRVLSTTPTPIGGLSGFAWSQIDPGAPQRIVRSATGRARRPASAFDYAVYLDIGGGQWSAFVKGGKAFVATPGGRITRQISG